MIEDRVYTQSIEKSGILQVFFPDYKVVREPIPPFFLGKKCILMTEKEVDPYPVPTILFTRKGLNLSSKEGVVKFLENRGYSISDSLKSTFQIMDDEVFFDSIKIFYLLKSFPSNFSENQSTVFEIFKNLFVSFKDSYSLYRKSELPYNVILSSLLTMMLKAKDPVNQKVSYGYKKVLEKNHSFYPLFRRILLDYTQSEMKEKDFITFLLNCSEVSK